MKSNFEKAVEEVRKQSDNPDWLPILETKEDKKDFPKRYTKYTMEDYFQTDVDDFDSGSFLFLSAKEVDIIVDDKLMEDIEEYDKKGIIVSTYCYTYKCYMKFLIVNYKGKPWHNNYTIRRGFTRTMSISDMAFQGTKDDYIEWMKIVEVPTSSPLMNGCVAGEKRKNIA